MEELLGVVVSFDFKMSLLEVYFPGGSDKRSIAYDKIRKFLISKGYESLSDGNYRNNEDTQQLCFNKILEFSEENKWFPLCINKLIIIPDSIYSNYADLLLDNVDKDYKIKMENLYKYY